MSGLTEQRKRIEDVMSAKYITGALRDISAIELKNMRDRFDQNGRFYAELRDLYQLMWQIAETSGSRATLAQGGTLYVAYTTNRHFYGLLNHAVMERFIASTGAADNCLIIGETGKQIWRSSGKKRRNVSFMSFRDDIPDANEAHSFLEMVKGNSQVFVFYPSFVSVFSQEAQMIDITYRPSSAPSAAAAEYQDAPQYLLEPDLSEMLDFFNTQVRYTLFERLLLETQLSRVAARLVKMDMADQNADALIAHETQELRRVYTSFSSRRMLETLVGYLQWHTQKTQPTAR